MNTYYPIFVDITNKRTLVIGGGRIAERKVRSLLRCHAEVKVVSPALTTGLKQLVQSKRITYKAKHFTPGDLKGIRLVICATNTRKTNRKASEESEKRGLLCNVVDVPELCNFIVPSTIRRGDLHVAISTGGSSPALAKKIRQELEQILGPEYTEFINLLKQLRIRIGKEIRGQEKRARIYEEFIDSDIRRFLGEGKKEKALEVVKKIMHRHSLPFPQ